MLYNAGLKRTLLGPVAMGGCRMLNVLLGMSVLRGPWRIEHWAVAAGIGVYIAGVTWFARNDARRSDRWQLIAATLVMLAGVGLVGSLPWLSRRTMDASSAAARVVALVHDHRPAGRIRPRARCSGDCPAVARTGACRGPPFDHGPDLPRRRRLLRRGRTVLRDPRRGARGSHDDRRAVGGREDETMLLGYNTNGMAHHDLFDAVELLADIGYESMAITIDHTALSPHARYSRQRIAAAAAAARAAKDADRDRDRGPLPARIPARSTNRRSSAATRPEDERRIDFYKYAVDSAAELGSDCVSLWSGRLPAGVERSEAIALARRRPAASRRICRPAACLHRFRARAGHAHRYDGRLGRTAGPSRAWTTSA